MAPYCDSAALLGTHLSEAKIEEIKIQGYKKIFLCLDNDATGQAIRLQLLYSKSLKGLQVLGLQKDIKNFDEDEMKQFLTRLE